MAWENMTGSCIYAAHNTYVLRTINTCRRVVAEAIWLHTGISTPEATKTTIELIVLLLTRTQLEKRSGSVDKVLLF